MEEVTITLPARCPRNEDTLEFLQKIHKLHDKYQQNMLLEKSNEAAELQKFYVALTSKMIDKLHTLAMYELQSWQEEHPSTGYMEVNED